MQTPKLDNVPEDGILVKCIQIFLVVVVVVVGGGGLKINGSNDVCSKTAKPMESRKLQNTPGDSTCNEM